MTQAIPDNITIATEHVPGADEAPFITFNDIPALRDGRRYLYVTWAQSQTPRVGSIIPIETDAIAQDGAPAYTGYDGNYYRGIPLNMPVEAGDHAMVLTPPYMSDHWMRGTVVPSTDNLRTIIDTITATAGGTTFDPESRINGYYWLRLSSARQGEAASSDVPEVFDIAGVSSWHGFPYTTFPLVDGERYVLVTGAARAPERRVGRIARIIGESGRWLTTADRDYVHGTPLNVLPETRGQNHRVMALDGTAAGQRGELRDYSRSRIVFTPDGSTEQVDATRWVLLRNSEKDRQFRPREDDTPELAALRQEARELYERMDRSVRVLVAEASWRGWSQHLIDVSDEVGINLVDTKRFARVNVNYVTNLYQRPDERNQDIALRNVDGREGEEERRNLIENSSYLGVIINEMLVLDVPEGQESVTRAMVEQALVRKRGYSVSLLDYNATIGMGVR